MSVSNFYQIKRVFVHSVITISILIMYVTAIVYPASSYLIPMQGSEAVAQSRVQIGIDALKSAHFIGEIQQTPEGMSFRWVDNRVLVHIPRFLNNASIISFTTWLHPAVDTSQNRPYKIISIDNESITTQRNVFVPRIYHMLNLPTIFDDDYLSLSVKYVFTSETPYWAFSGVSVKKIDTISNRLTHYVGLYVLLMLTIPFVYSGICWYATKHARVSLAVGLGVALILAIRTQIMYEDFGALVLQGIQLQRILTAVIVGVVVALIVTLYHWLSPFWQNIKRWLYLYIPVVHTRLFIVTAITLASIWCIVVFVIYPVTDWQIHEYSAQRMQTHDELVSYFLFHITIIALHNISLGLLSLQFSTILLIFCIILLLCTMVWNMSASILPHPLFLVGAVLFFLMFAPIPLLFMSDAHMYFGYVATNVYHNPTVLMLKPFALMHLLLLQILLTQEHSNNDLVLWRVFWGVTLLTVLAKASYIIVMLPALGLFVGWRLIHQHPHWRHNMMTLIVMGSAAAVPIIFQYMLLYDSGTRQLGIRNFSPMIAQSWFLYGGLIIKLFGSFAFMISLRLVVPDILKKIEIQLLGIATAISLAYIFVLCEGRGCMNNDFVIGNWGNFGWSVQICLFLLLFAGIRYLAIATVQQKGNHRWYFFTPYVIAVLHIVSGFFWVLRNMTNLFAY